MIKSVTPVYERPGTASKSHPNRVAFTVQREAMVETFTFADRAGAETERELFLERHKDELAPHLRPRKKRQRKVKK